MTELIRTKLEKKQEWEDEWTEKYIIHCFWKEAFSHDVDVLLGLSYPTVSTFFHSPSAMLHRFHSMWKADYYEIVELI